MDDKLIIDASRVSPEGDDFEGEVNAVDLDEAFVKAVGAVRYHLFAQVFGTELLVRGELEQDFSLVCSRCGEDYDDTVFIDDFTASFEINEKSQEVDLTDEVRESIILALPTYPVCSEACPGVLQKTQEPRDDRWSALDGLTVEKN